VQRPAARLATPLTVLWPEHDPLFPRIWADAAIDFYEHVRLRVVDGVGHFAPLEYPQILADEIHERLRE
jgi:pimeloyl-ACP methyl ester carboxylesterase